MANSGKRKVQSKGEFTLPKDFREENNIEEGEDYVCWKIHSRDRSKLIIEKQDNQE